MFSKLSGVFFSILVYVLQLPVVLAQPGGTGAGGLFGGDEGSSSINPDPGSSSINPGQSGSFDNPLAFNSLNEFLNALLKVIIQIGFPIVVIAIIYTGFLFVKAQGDPEGLKTARNAFLWTVIGALLILGALALSALIKGTVDEITLLS